MIVPAILGTSEGGACEIASTGIGRVGTTDDCYFGRGIHFTDMPQPMPEPKRS